MLITAGNKLNFNTMTAAWGGFGFLWNVPVTYIFIRPHRHTFSFTEENQFYTLNFLEKRHKNILTYCGTHSGKNVDKIKESGLVPLETNRGNIYFEQAKLVIECSKLYFDDIRPGNFLDKLIDKNYPKKDYHRMYIGKVVKCLIKD
jgi:flavin reductase (DIM6/NTAB) family NADH-FMN oxidoreductase RutF